MAAVTTLPAAFTVGQILTSTQMNNLRGAFRVLQVVYATTTTQATTTSATFATTNLSGSITPSSTSSKVLILANVQIGSNAAAQQSGLRIFDGSTAVLTNNRAMIQNGAGDLQVLLSMMFLDSPNTISAKTYTMQFARTSGSGTTTAQANSDPSTIILCEISA